MNNLCNLIAAGNHYAIIIDADRYAWVWGSSDHGCTGLHRRDLHYSAFVSSPKKIDYLPNVRAVSLGQCHSILLDTEGTAWVTGWNQSGQLGLKHVADVEFFEKIPDIPRMIHSACYNHSVFLDEDYNVWVCGENGNGQLGLGDRQNRTVLTKIPNLPAIKFVAVGHKHTILIDEFGIVWVCGENRMGEIGLGERSNSLVPVQLQGLPTIVNASAGAYHSVFVDENCEVWSCGDNSFGQLGYPNSEIGHQTEPIKVNFITETLVMNVSCGMTCSLFLDKNGVVWASTASTTPQIISAPAVAAIKEGNKTRLFLDYEGSLWCKSTKQAGFSDKVCLPPISWSGLRRVKSARK